jgi:nicotinamide-nucleotide adenylyltransferase
LDKLGVVVGRFQIFHNDHLKYVLAGKSLCEHLIIGITNPDPTHSKDDSSDPHRHLGSSNPLTYFERYTILKAVLNEHFVSYRNFSIIPFPINFPELYCHYVPSEAVFYLTIYDSWGKKKLELLKSRGLRTQVIWEKPQNEKGVTGSEVRRRIASGEPWDHLVPLSVTELILKWDVRSRLRIQSRATSR